MSAKTRTLLFLSPTPVFDMQGKSGKEVVYLSLKTFSQDYNLELIAPGQDPQLSKLRFHPLRSGWFLRMKSIPFLGHLFNYFYFVYLWFAVKQIARKYQIRPDVIYMAGPWMSLIGHNLPRKPDSILVNRYYGTSIPYNYRKTLKNKLRYALKIAGYRKSGDLVIMTNDGTRGEEFLKNQGCPPDKIRFWTNGVHFMRELPDHDQAKTLACARWRIPSNHHILLTVSRLAGWKRVDRAIQLLEEVCQSHPETTLFIAGDGEQRTLLEQQVQRKGLTDKVIFAGSINRDALDLIYPASDIFISLYEHSNAGNPLFESMINGCCIYTYESPEVREYLDEESAILVKQGDPDAGALKRILEDPQRRKSLGANARMRAQEKLSPWEDRMKRELQEINQVLQAKSIRKP